MLLLLLQPQKTNHKRVNRGKQINPIIYLNRRKKENQIVYFSLSHTQKQTQKTENNLFVAVIPIVKLRTAQRAMERKMLDLQLKDKIPCSEIRKRTKIIDIIEYTLKQKWKWAGHIARLEDNRWTKRCTEWQPRRGKRSRGRPSRRWQDDITEKEGTTWIRKATDRRQWKTLMEGYILQWMDKA